ncbi:MAG: hypothetical protein M1305_06200 [Candidatus Marsarchaeota archaeon]|nr:hypothetical protein [Candidatus Marsarchaeota archaeon]
MEVGKADSECGAGKLAKNKIAKQRTRTTATKYVVDIMVPNEKKLRLLLNEAWAEGAAARLAKKRDELLSDAIRAVPAGEEGVIEPSGQESEDIAA